MKHFKILIIKPYNDLVLYRFVSVGEIIDTDEIRAYAICNAGLAQIYSITNY
jgi:hypothetical protein